LVFMYDVADSTSYKGEPTTNVFTPLGFAGPGSGNDNNVYFDVNGTGTFIRLGFGQTFGNYTIQPNDVVYKYNLGGYGCHYHGNDVAISNGKYATFSFDYYISPDTVNLGVENSLLANFEQALSYGITLPNTNLGVWQSVSFTVGPTSGGNLRSLLYPGACGPRLASSGYILFKNPQVEFLNHKTPFVQTTRSVTQALLPLVSNNTLDLSTVSFDSNGQIYFDGTDDTIIPDLTGISFGNEITIDIINNSDEIRSSSVISGGTGGNQDLNVHLPWSDGNVYWDAGRPFNRVYKYAGNAALGLHHWVFTKNAATGIMNIYLDGMLWAQNTGQTSAIPTIGTSRIGMYTQGSYFGYYHKGAVPVVKIYNREFTQEEVQQSYNKYKTRFNLS